MSDETPPELTSWKEIAARLQVTVRTAQEWEKKRGLPVRRVPGEGRSRVYLRVDELEAWLDGQLVDDPSADSQPGAGALARFVAARSRMWGSVAVILILATTAAALYFLRPAATASAARRDATSGSPPTVATSSSRPPAADPVDLRILPDTIVAQGENGEELWRRRFEGRLNQQVYEHKSHSFTFDDVDRDGGKDTVFIVRRKDMPARSVLSCFDEDGEEIWSFKPGDHVHTSDTMFTDAYNVAEFRPFDLPDGRRAIVVVGAHHIDFPTQITVLDAADGSVISEYWHSGHIGTEPGQLAVADVNRDGSPELYLAGISNGHWRATLVVLDPLTMRGAGEEEDSSFQLQDLGPPREIARILFRRSAINQAIAEWNGAEHVWATPEFVTVSVTESFRGDATPGVIYDLSPALAFTQLRLNSVFPMIHSRLREEGTISIDLEEQKRLLGAVDYVVEPPSLGAPRVGAR